jgi:superfamily II DNA or RNA helicase
LIDIKFDLIICDEAHYLGQDRFSVYLESMNADKILFFTATPIREELEDSGMMNFDLFGKVIHSVPPSELILDGYIVAPLVHKLECRTNKRAEKVNIIDVIVNAFIYQHKETVGNGMPYHQMLVACRDVAVDIEETINNDIRKIWDEIESKSDGKITAGEVDIYTVTSGTAYKNGTDYAGGRYAALDEIKNNAKNAIIAHYDTLSEGIDIGTLSGVVFMREMSKSKLIQTIGRPARPYIDDLDQEFNPRKELFDIKSGFDIRKKRRSIITFPVIDGKWISGTSGQQVAEAFIAGGYGDLLDYMPKTEFKPTGKKELDGMTVDETTFMSSIIEHKCERDLVDLRKLFDFS